MRTSTMRTSTGPDVLGMVGRMVAAAAEQRMAQGRTGAMRSTAPAPTMRTTSTVQPARAAVVGGAVRTCPMCTTGTALCQLPGCPMLT